MIDKVYPSLVKAETITVSYKEDKEHLSFAIMIIQWQHPKSNQNINSIIEIKITSWCAVGRLRTH